MSYFPNLNEKVINGKLCVDDAMYVWSRMAKSFNRLPLCVILHGSVLSGTCGALSDIDLLIISGDSGIPKRVVKSVEGYLVDLTILPLSSVVVSAQKAALSRATGEITGILEGRVIAGSEELAQTIRAKVEVIFSSGKIPCAQLELGLEARVFGRLTDMTRMRDDAHVMISRSEVLCALTQIGSLRELKQLLPPHVAFERLSLALRDTLNRLACVPVEQPDEFVSIVLREFRIRSFSRWDDLSPEIGVPGGFTGIEREMVRA